MKTASSDSFTDHTDFPDRWKSYVWRGGYKSGKAHITGSATFYWRFECEVSSVLRDGQTVFEEWEVV